MYISHVNFRFLCVFKFQNSQSLLLLTLFYKIICRYLIFCFCHLLFSFRIKRMFIFHSVINQARVCCVDRSSRGEQWQLTRRDLVGSFGTVVGLVWTTTIELLIPKMQPRLDFLSVSDINLISSSQ